jgi:hypothetical protein
MGLGRWIGFSDRLIEDDDLIDTEDRTGSGNLFFF